MQGQLSAFKKKGLRPHFYPAKSSIPKFPPCPEGPSSPAQLPGMHSHDQSAFPWLFPLFSHPRGSCFPRQEAGPGKSRNNEAGERKPSGVEGGGAKTHGFTASKQPRANSISHLLKAITVKRSNLSANRSFGSSRGTHRGNPTEKQGSQRKGQLQFHLFQPVPFGSGGTEGI